MTLDATHSTVLSCDDYVVLSPEHIPVMGAPESCRYPPEVEQSLLNAGYTIMLHGRRIGRAPRRKGAR